MGQTTSPGTAPGLKVATDIHCLLYNPFLALLCRWLIWRACGYHASQAVAAPFTIKIG